MKRLWSRGASAIIMCVSLAACATNGVQDLDQALGSAANMSATASERRGSVEYRPTDSQSFWFALIPAASSVDAVMSHGLPPTAKDLLEFCLAEPGRHIAAGFGDEMWCMDHSRAEFAEVFVVKKARGESAVIDVVSTEEGYNVVSAR